MPASRRARRTTTAAVALSLLGLLGGCGGDDGEPEAAESPSSSPTTSLSPSESPSASAKPELPTAPAAKDNTAGREAFARFVIDRWGYALRTNRSDAVTDLSPRKSQCQGCRELRNELAQRRKEGWYVDFAGADVRRVTLTRGSQAETFLATAKVDIPASRSYFDDGSFRNDNEAHSGATFEVLLRLDKKSYSLLAFQVG